MKDFVLVSAGWLLNQQVTTYDETGKATPNDGEYQRQGADTVYIFAEFMRDKGLLNDGVEVTRAPNFELRFSQLTEGGQTFARAHLDKWMQSLDRAGSKRVDASGLERRWAKFSAA